MSLNRLCAAAAIALAGSLPWAAHAQTPTATVAQTPRASDGGKAELLPPRPLAATEDPVNRKAVEDTVDGLALSLTIDGPNVTLDTAVAARVPRRLARADRNAGDNVVKATAFAGGRALSTTVVPDPVLNASEGEGLVRLTRRQVSLVLAADQAVDRVTIEAPATGASATLDVRQAYARLCEADRAGKWCPQR
ncbi:MAG: hypothetical protein AB1430_00655 [Pseudomonadota bacterium]